MSERLKAAGFTDKEITLFSVPEHPEDGGIVVVLPGTDKVAKAILLLAHLDVVEARREDWERDPFKMIEEDGYFYGRGVADDKAHAAIFTDSRIRLKSDKPLKHTVKMALTCGEETAGTFNGAEYLAAHKRDLIDAEFSLNEGGGGRLKSDGSWDLMSIQAGEKFYADFILEVTAPGGHSSVPFGDNPIYILSKALSNIENYRFPTHLNPVTHAYLGQAADRHPAGLGEMMRRLANDPSDEEASKAIAQDPYLEAMTRTTSVATLLEAGHAQNALPQRAKANVNCRIIPGETVESTKEALLKFIGNEQVQVTDQPSRNPLATQPLFSERILGPIRKVADKHFPGIPLIPTMLVAATDALYLAAGGIPTCGVPGLFFDPENSGVHGLNERIRVKSVLEGRAYLYDLIKVYAKGE